MMRVHGSTNEGTVKMHQASVHQYIPMQKTNDYDSHSQIPSYTKIIYLFSS